MNWVDRLNLTGAYACIKDYYNALVEATDGDGDKDYLIDDKYFEGDSSSKSDSYEVGNYCIVNGKDSDGNTVSYSCIIAATFSYDNSENTFDSQVSIFESYIAAALAAFDRDHPEVFWMSDSRGVLNWKGSDSKGYIALCLDGFRQSGYDETVIEEGIEAVSDNVQIILGGVESGASVYDTLNYFDTWLTEHNQYNTDVTNARENYHNAWECLSALKGCIGTEGPVCEGYARAFKVLCDRSNIPCVLVDGSATSKPDTTGEGHMWNYAKIGEKWYAVDVTWDDPATVGNDGNRVDSGAKSGSEKKKWFLLGSATEIESGFTFIDSHPEENNMSPSTPYFTNGPELSTTSYAEDIAEQGEISLESCTLNQTGTISATYGDKFGDVEISGLSMTTSNGIEVAGTFEWVNSETVLTSVGDNTANVKFTLASDKTRSIEISTPVNITVGKKPLKLASDATATVQDKTYDGSNTATVITKPVLEGVLDGDTITLDCTATFDDKNAGTNKAVTVSCTGISGTSVDKYSFEATTVTTTGTISKATLSATGGSVQDKTYDGTTNATIVTSPTLTGVVTGETITPSWKAEFNDKNVGTGKTVTISCIDLGDAAANYEMSENVSTTAAITAKPLSVTAGIVANKVYDGSAEAKFSTDPSLVSSEIMGSDMVTLAFSAAFADATVGDNKTVNLTYTLEGTDSTNYAIADSVANTTTASITSAGVSSDYVVTGTDSLTATYGDALGSVSLEGLGMVSGSDSAQTIAGSFSWKDGNQTFDTVGDVKCTVVFKPSDSNYAETEREVTVKVSKKQVNVKAFAANTSKTYDGTTDVTFSIAPSTDDILVTDSGVLFSYSASYDNKAVGTNKTITVTYQLNGTNAENYQLAKASETITGCSIAAKSLDVTAGTIVSKTYDGNATATFSTEPALSGVIGSDSVTLTSTATFQDASAGTDEDVNVTYALSGDDAGNYALATSSATLKGTITQKTLTASGGTVSSKTYDGTTTATVTAAPTLSGVIGSDEVSVDASSCTAAFADKTVGTGKNVTITCENLTGAAAGNYVLETKTTTTTADISKKQLSVTAGTVGEKEYDGNATASFLVKPTLSQDGIASGDAVALSATAAFENADVGDNKKVTVTYTLEGSDAANYALASYTAETTANIVAAAEENPEDALSDYTVTYSEPLSATYGGNLDAVSLNGLSMVSSGGEVLEGTFYWKVKEQTIRKIGDATYTAVFQWGVNENSKTVERLISVNVAQKGIRVVPGKVADKVYDGTTSAKFETEPSLTSTDILDGDVVQLVATAAFADATAGEGKTVNITYSLTGDNASCYKLSTTSGTDMAAITKATESGGTTTGGSTTGDTTGGSTSGGSTSGGTTGGGTSGGEPAGSTTTATDPETGAVTETTSYPDGSSKVVVTDPDGTTATVVDLKGKQVSVEFEVPESAAEQAEGAVRLPVAVPADLAVSVKAPEGASVELPTLTEPGAYTVVVRVSPDGTEEPVRKSVVTGDGVAFEVPDGAVTVKVADRRASFPDVSGAEWYAEDGVVDFAFSRDIISGMEAPDGTRTFAGDAPMSRAMLATVLHRLESAPAAASAASFADVAEGRWYAESVAWAASEGIVLGYGDGTAFGPDDGVTREQMAVMMYRYAQSLGLDTSASADLSGYSDAGELTFGREAMGWAVAEGLIRGYGDGSNALGGKSGATRAEVCAVVERLVRYMVA